MGGKNPSLPLSLSTELSRKSCKSNDIDLQVLYPYLDKPSGDTPSSGNTLEKNKIVDEDFSEELERDMEGDKSFSFSLLNSKPQIKISPKVLDELRHEWRSSLIVTLFGKTIKYDTLCSKVVFLWNLRGGFKALDLGENYFLFTFQSVEDRINVYTKGPWVVMDHFLSVRRWEPNFKPSAERRNMKSVCWVRFRELPVEFFHDKALYNVSKLIGRPIKKDHSAQRKFTRVCIEIDLSKPLCPVIEVEGKDCVVEYESLHSFCFDCSHFGHIKDIDCDGVIILEKAAPERNKLECSSKLMKEDDLDKVKPKETEKGEDGSSAMGNGRKQSDFPQQQQPQKPPQLTFSTVSPDCLVKYEYYRDVITGNEIKEFKPNNNGKLGSHISASLEPQPRDLVAKTETCDSRSSESKEEHITPIVENGDVKEAKDFECSRNNLQVSKMKISDDDDDFDLKRLFQAIKLIDSENEEKLSDDADCETSSDTSDDESFDDYPTADFNDFEKARRKYCFSVGQVWAVYDTPDSMPRAYAQIDNIISICEFKLSITWLKPDPDEEEEIKWVDAELPVSCGTLRKADTETTETTDDLLMFSHRVKWKKGQKIDTIKIFPRKGETWALFKNWNLNWHSNPESKRTDEFEFVEILSNYREDTGVFVAYLGKVKGFSCLFCRILGVDSFQIPPSRLFGFSHRVPCFRLSGEEIDDVPKNSFELDPASLPSNIEEIDIPKDCRVREVKRLISLKLK